ncbi:ABC transporter substrate-binding protein [Ktedonosporobacter rubrisoli]|uniref:ABC transporter substrate-binding protein n=1 Tax=Ktedonosporobacter rubrisoli TaxID=2509675 RepID=A0A4V0YZ06_KTERU|nr:ABC transporter substrate-binding protein [Ktedonosporobacter rubrisoli]QBD78051.1 ABC transporter substrate-binding protein [Ktedonosporobacter rubrisoli]
MVIRPDNKGETSITRRQALQMVLITGGSIVAGDWLAACGGGQSQNQKAQSIVPTPREQTLVVDQTDFTVFDSFNPFIPNGWQTNAGFDQVSQEYLFYYNLVTGETKPWLGKEWKYNANYTSLTLTLNPKAHWNDGQPLTSKDVKFSIDMLKSNAALAGGADFQRFVKDVTTPDAQTVVINLNEPDPRFHYFFICGIVSARLRIMPEHIWSKKDPMSFQNNPPVMSGPYKLDRTIPAQFMYVWKKDPNYWNKDELDPKPEYVVYRSSPKSQDAEVGQFKQAQFDITTNIDYKQASAIKNTGYANISIITKFVDPCPRAFAINCDPSKGLLADPRMHWAISYLVDRKQDGEKIWPVPTPVAQFPWANYQGNDKWSNQELASKYQLTYDPKKAAALLDEMGATLGSNGKRSYQGKPLHYEVSTSSKVGDPEYIFAQNLADELNKVGIDATVRYYEGATWQDRFNQGNFDITGYYICGNVFDPGQLYTYFETAKTKPIGQDATAGGNLTRAQYKDLDELARKLDGSDPSDPKNKGLYDQALEAFYKNLPYIPICQTVYPSIVNTSYWSGWPLDDNLNQVPLNWWGQFLFVIGNLKPAAKS